MNNMNWMAVAPEIVLLVMALVITLADLWVTDERRTPTYWMTQATLAVVGCCTSGPSKGARPCTRCSAWWWPTPWVICWASSPAAR